MSTLSLGPVRTGASVLCPCLVGSSVADVPELEHFVSEHDHDCGGWTWDPPCGGCLQCIIAQTFYYESIKERK